MSGAISRDTSTIEQAGRIARKHFAVRASDRFPLTDVDDVDTRAHDILQRRACARERRRDVGERLLRLPVRVARADDRPAAVGGSRARNEHLVADPHRARVADDGLPRRCRSRNCCVGRSWRAAATTCRKTCRPRSRGPGRAHSAESSRPRYSRSAGTVARRRWRRACRASAASARARRPVPRRAASARWRRRGDAHGAAPAASALRHGAAGCAGSMAQGSPCPPAHPDRAPPAGGASRPRCPARPRARTPRARPRPAAARIPPTHCRRRHRPAGPPVRRSTRAVRSPRFPRWRAQARPARW